MATRVHRVVLVLSVLGALACSSSEVGDPSLVFQTDAGAQVADASEVPGDLTGGPDVMAPDLSFLPELTGADAASELGGGPDLVSEPDAGEPLCDPADCPFGCVEGEDLCARLQPANVDAALLCASEAEVTLSGEIGIDTDADTLPGVSGAVLNIVVQESGPELFVVSVGSLTVELGARIEVKGRRALVLLSCGDVNLRGVVAAAADGAAGGPGGFDGGAGSVSGSAGQSAATAGRGPVATGGGAGRAEYADPYRQSGGGGGGHGAVGGAGGAAGDTALAGGAGGQAWAAPSLTPLAGGAGGGGGGGFARGGAGGGGGGAVQISSGGRLVVEATGGVHAGGAGGAVSSDGNWGAGGGGGAGGAILLEGASVVVRGVLAAGGGAGAGARTEYEPWGYLCPAGTPQAGEDGRFDALPAEGGRGCTGDPGAPAGAGGAGGAAGGDVALGGSGERGATSGGGGGGVGRIRLNVAAGARAVLDGVFSPDCEGLAGGVQRCTAGEVETY